MQLPVKAHGAGKALVGTLFDGQGECGSTGGQAEELEEVLHFGFVVGVGNGIVVLKMGCWLAVMAVMAVLLRDNAVL
jgi:hypothetical protein